MWPIVVYLNVNRLKSPSVKLGTNVFECLTSFTPNRTEISENQAKQFHPILFKPFFFHLVILVSKIWHILIMLLHCKSKFRCVCYIIRGCACMCACMCECMYECTL